MTKRILDQHDPEKEILVTSAGMLHYDVPLAIWLNRGGRTHVILDNPMEYWNASARQQYCWLKNHPGITLEEPSGRINKRKAMILRDRKILEMARILEIGCLNHKGKMNNLIISMRSDKKKMIHRKMLPSEKSHLSYLPLKHYENLSEISEFNDYLWHYTRSRFSPWPGKTQLHYLNDLIDFDRSAPYTADVVLERILNQKLIEAGSSLIRGNYSVVSFTGADWETIKTFFVWQSHLRRIRFEPFALGIKKSIAEALGILPVIYGNDDCYKQLPDNLRWRFQNQGNRVSGWRTENEWRYFGSLDLNLIKKEYIRIITP